MEIGSVIELDDWCMYQLPENSADSMKNFGLPFMGAEKPEYKMYLSEWAKCYRSLIEFHPKRVWC